jgi:hypothetical protein
MFTFDRRLVILLFSFCAALFTGCKTSTIESRRLEKMTSYNQLSPEEKELVDQGQIKIGMSADAVYVAWGRPSEVLQEETVQTGKTSSWRYYGTWMQETRYWAYRETSRPGNDLYLERYLVSDYNPRDYVRAEIVFKDGKVISWRTLPRPAS